MVRVNPAIMVSLYNTPKLFAGIQTYDTNEAPLRTSNVDRDCRTYTEVRRLGEGGGDVVQGVILGIPI